MIIAEKKERSLMSIVFHSPNLKDVKKDFLNHQDTDNHASVLMIGGCTEWHFGPCINLHSIELCCILQ